MARTVVPITALALNALTVDPTVTTADQANGMYIAAAGSSAIAIRVKNTFAGAKNLICRAGVQPPSQASILGDLTTSFAQNAVKWFVLHSERFTQVDGSIYLDFESGFTGEVTAFSLPKGV